MPEPQAKPPGWATLFCMMSSQATNCTRPAKPHLHTNNPQRKQPRQVPKIWQGCLFYLTRNEAIVRAQITNLRQRERSAQLIGFLSVLLAFSSLSLFVITKRFQKRPDKRNSLRLRLRSDSLLSQWKGWLTLRALRWKMYDVFGVGLTAKRWHFCSQGWSIAELLGRERPEIRRPRANADGAWHAGIGRKNRILKDVFPE